MDNIIIIGSGPSGLHFALSLLQKGYNVTMLDVGYNKQQIPNLEDSFNDIKRTLKDPVRYFLGEDFQAVIYPDFESEYYGFPPSKDYVFTDTPSNNVKPTGFAPLFSFAQGGLAEAWTGGSYPFNDEDLQDFPFSYEDIEPYYDEVSNRIGITGTKDNLIDFFPFHKNLMPPIDLDEHSQVLLESYSGKERFFNDNIGFFLGRSRTAVLSHDKGQRKKCDYSGRCLWGCPSEALYTPSITLRECMTYPNFNYIKDNFVSHFKYDSTGKVISVIARSARSKAINEFKVDKLILAAGTLSSTRIFLNSIFFNSGDIITLKGLMDNRQIMAPFLNLKMIGKRYNPDSFQYHQLAIALKGEDTRSHVHGLITTLKTALFHPIIQSIPLDIKTAIFFFRNVHAALGVVNVNFSDQRRTSNYLTINPNSKTELPELVIHYEAEAGEKNRIKRTMKRLNNGLRRLGCIMPPGMAHLRPMGASVHYSGTIPMSTKKTPFTVSKDCQSHDFDNLYIVDGTTFPFLPSKNLTFTLMANAVRVAECAF